MSSPDVHIEVRGVTKIYRRGGEELVVLDALDVDVPRGDFVSLMGPSGSGKTTLLNMIGGLDRPDRGSVIVDGEDITAMAPGELPHWRAETVGFVFQAFNLVPVLTAYENVLLPLQLTPLSRAEQRRQAEFALDMVDLKDRMGHRPSQLSGGQEQRVAIARAIATDPGILLADEPTGDLDRENAGAIMDLLLRLNDELGKTIVIVTHDPLVAERSKRLVRMDKGKLMEGSERAGAA